MRNACAKLNLERQSNNEKNMKIQNVEIRKTIVKQIENSVFHTLNWSTSKRKRVRNIIKNQPLNYSTNLQTSVKKKQ